MWFQILSEFFVNIAAAWFIVVFVEPQFVIITFENIPILTFKLILGIFSLVVAKVLRERNKKNA